MLTTDENGVPKAEMPQRWAMEHPPLAIGEGYGMHPTQDGAWVMAKDVQELVAQFNLLAQVASIMVPKGRGHMLHAMKGLR
jgi:hypothetical protein